MGNYRPTPDGPIIYGDPDLAHGPPRLPNVLDHLLFTEHDQCCTIWGCEEPAVLDSGIFQPCWTHQAEGYRTLKPGERRWRKKPKNRRRGW